MKLCKRCNLEFDDDIQFCTKCGEKISPNGKKYSVVFFVVVFLFVVGAFAIFSSHLESLSKLFSPQCKYLAAVEYEGKWGYIDTKGNFAIPPRFKNVNSFCCGRAIVREIIDKDFSIINDSGDTVIGTGFPSFTNYNYGYVEAYITSGDSLYYLLNGDAETYLWGDKDEYMLLDVDGKPAFNSEIFGSVKGVKREIIGENLYSERVRNGKYTVNDFDGNVKFELSNPYSEVYDYSDGLFLVVPSCTLQGSIKGYEKVLYMDINGNVVIDTSKIPMLSKGKWNPHSFSEGLSVLESRSEKHTVCVINTEGKVVKKLNLASLKSFCGGYSVFLDSESRFGLIDKNCHLIRILNFARAGRPSKCGLTAVMDENGKWGYVDMNGKVIIECKFDSAETFVDVNRRNR